MAGAGIKLYNTGDVLTASDVNTYLQQQVVMVFASAAARTSALSGVLAEGMVTYLQDTNSVQVYNGTAFVDVGGSSPLPFVGCSIHNSTAVSIANNTSTALTFDQEAFDTNSFHSTSVNTSRITIPTGLSGKYLINTSTSWDLSGTGTRKMSLYVNGGVAVALYEEAGSASNYNVFSKSCILSLTAADYLELFVFQTSGGALNCFARSLESPFSIEFLGA